MADVEHRCDHCDRPFPYEANHDHLCPLCKIAGHRATRPCPVCKLATLDTVERLRNVELEEA